MRRELRVHYLPRDRQAGRSTSSARPSEQEEDLLDKAPGLTPTSRLGCQAVIDDPDAEIVVVIPRFTINQVSESAEE